MGHLWGIHQEHEDYIVSLILESGSIITDITHILCNGNLNYCDVVENNKCLGVTKEKTCSECIYLANKSREKYENSAKENTHINFHKLEIGIEMDMGKEHFQKPLPTRHHSYTNLCSYYRCDETNISYLLEREYDFASMLIKQSEGIYNALNELMKDKYENTLAILFNGRFSPFGEMLNWCISNKVQVLVHERGILENQISIRFNNKALDNQTLNNHLSTYNHNIWDTRQIRNITRLLKTTFLSGSNSIVKSWKNSNQKEYKIKSHKKYLICIFLSSTDEAYNDMGTPYIELQTILLKSIALIQQEHRYFDIIIKPHPDSISRIDQTIQQSIVQSLIDIECIEGIRIIWPEEKVGNVDLSENADLCIVPHSTTIFEISTGGNCISACFADSPFATIADELLMPHDIYDHTLLCKKMLEMLKRRIPDKARKEAEIEKIILNYIFWNSISYSSYQKYGLSGTLSANIRCLEAESLQSLFYGDKRILENINERYRSKMIEKNLDIQTIMQENDYGYLSSNDNNSNAAKIQKVDKKVMQLNLDTNRIESNGEEYKLTTIFNDDQKAVHYTRQRKQDIDKQSQYISKCKDG